MGKRWQIKITEANKTVKIPYYSYASSTDPPNINTDHGKQLDIMVASMCRKNTP